MRHSPELMTSMSAEALLQVYDDEICKMSHVLFLFLAKSGDLKTRFYTIYLFFFLSQTFHELDVPADSVINNAALGSSLLLILLVILIK